MKGWPDYTRVTGLVDNYDEYGENYPVGIGDGAGRLGSIKTYDMRGRVWWMDDFEASILKWSVFAAGVGGSQALSTAQARNGNQSVRLVTNTGPGHISSIIRHLPLPRKRIIGIEWHLAMADFFGMIDAVCYAYDGTNRTYAAMRIDESVPAIYYRNDTPGWTDTGFSPNLTAHEDHFHDLKMVFDYATDEWIRVMWDHQELALDREAMQTGFDGTQPHLQLNINAVGDGANSRNTYVDDVIITIMEPE